MPAPIDVVPRADRRGPGERLRRRPGGRDPAPAVQAYEVVDGSRPHDVAPAIDGGVWFTGQRAGFLGHFNPSTQIVTQVPLGQGSAPHGVIVGPDGAAWVTDSGLNAIVRVDSTTREVRSYPLPPAARAPTSTPRHSTARECCGSPARPACMDGLIHGPGA